MLHDETCAHLKEVILPFWHGLRDDKRGGFCGYVGFDLARDWEAARGCILNSRILWAFSQAAIELQDERCLHDAHHAYRYFRRFVDREQGGVYWSISADGKPLDMTKHTYCQAFAVYGLAAYYEASGDKTALGQALSLFDLMEKRMLDEGGYGEAFHRDFTPADNEKLSENGVSAGRTMNTLLHVMEAYTLLYRVSGDERVKGRIKGILDIFLVKVYNPEQVRLEVFFDREMRPLLNMQSFGHDIEASWLIYDAAKAVLPEAMLEPFRSLALNLAQSVYDRAYDHGSLLNEQVQGMVEKTRVWWVQAEAVIGFANAWQLGGGEKYRSAARDIWTTIQGRFADKRSQSEWFWSLTPELEPIARPIVEPWKCPYHNSRMCLELNKRGI